MPAHRKVFEKGQRLPNGCRVLDPASFRMPYGDGKFSRAITVVCHCGVPFVVRVSNIPVTRSCGCLSRSKGSRNGKRFQAFQPVVQAFQDALLEDIGYVIQIAEARFEGNTGP